MSSAFHLYIEKCQREWDQLIHIELHQILFWLFAYMLKQQRWINYNRFIMNFYWQAYRGKEKCPIFAGQLDSWKCQAHWFSHSIFNQLEQYRSKLLWQLRPLHSKKTLFHWFVVKEDMHQTTVWVWQYQLHLYFGGLVRRPVASPSSPLPTPPSRSLHQNHGI